MKRILTLWIPIVALVLATYDGFQHLPWLFDEIGLIENLTAVFLIAGLVFLVPHAILHFKTMTALDRMLLFVLILGSVYFAGEELSWGQHFGEEFFGVVTEKGRWEGNYQNEMNLHNMSGPMSLLLDRLPRTLMTIGIAIGGIIFPFCEKKLPGWIEKYVPGKEALLVSILAVFVSVPNKLVKLFVNHESHFDAGEMKEFYIALFILLFVVNFVRVTKKRIAA